MAIWLPSFSHIIYYMLINGHSCRKKYKKSNFFIIYFNPIFHELVCYYIPSTHHIRIKFCLFIFRFCTWHIFPTESHSLLLSCCHYTSAVPSRRENQSYSFCVVSSQTSELSLGTALIPGATPLMSDCY